ncbi:MAG: tRNA cyclic N6-threonylcarbamoyladenosine(37) synthase TcdA [Desulfuromonas sp.]|nr:MAG: tRNA cyclic N6-threonylcarbamoyladenosine(37) synthase TcdA [Desulfuromonas sp.]
MSEHRFSRMELLVGQEGLRGLGQASVAVFGVGGVGSYAAEALSRAGIGRLTLVDFDDICLTNVNRQIHALDGTIGRSKVEVMAERCRAINPGADVIPLQEFYSAETSDALLAEPFDYVLDCIDHMTAKLHLIETCLRKPIRLVSSMGAANKLDPTQVKLSDLADTQKCRLARIIRKELRKRGIERGVKVVYSTEEFRPLSDQAAICAEDCICPNKQDQKWRCTDRRVILGSSSYIPPIFGLTMAGEVIRELVGDAPSPPPSPT